MIYLQNTTGPQWLRIPAAGAHDGDDAGVLALTSVLDAALKVVLPFAVPAGVYQYAEGKVRLPDDLPVGDYGYTLSEGGRTVSQGVARIGSYDRHAEGGRGVEDFEFSQL